jgi:coproporphyrinogen III oxidase-like Fe-S oxidoreductase
MNSGWAFQEFRSQTGYELQDEWQSDITELIQLGWAEQTPERFFLTRKGMRFADAAAQYFLR